MTINTVEDSGTSIPSWGIWPGAANLSRVNRFNGAVASKESFLTRGHSRGVFKRVYGRKSSLPSSEERKLAYQRKVRILFSWKPPALPEPEITTEGYDENKSSSDSWEAYLDSQVVLLSGVPWWMTDCNIRDGASGYGQVRAVRVLGDSLTGTTTGLALLEYTQKTSAQNLLADQGFGWKPYGEHEKFTLRFHAVPPTLLLQFSKPTSENKVNEFSPHWSFGTFLSPETLEALYQLSGTSSSLVASRGISQSSISSPSSSIQQLEKCPDSVPQTASYQSPEPADFKFPFAAAAVIARVLRTNLSKNSSQVVSGNHKRIRPLSDDVYEAFPTVKDNDFLNQIKEIKMPYWGASLHEPAQLPPKTDMPFPSYEFPAERYYRPYADSDMYPINARGVHEIYSSWGSYPPNIPIPMDLHHQNIIGVSRRPSQYPHPGNATSYFSPYV